MKELVELPVDLGADDNQDDLYEIEDFEEDEDDSENRTDAVEMTDKSDDETYENYEADVSDSGGRNQGALDAQMTAATDVAEALQAKEMYSDEAFDHSLGESNVLPTNHCTPPTHTVVRAASSNNNGPSDTDLDTTTDELIVKASLLAQDAEHVQIVVQSNEHALSPTQATRSNNEAAHETLESAAVETAVRHIECVEPLQTQPARVQANSARRDDNEDIGRVAISQGDTSAEAENIQVLNSPKLSSRQRSDSADKVPAGARPREQQPFPASNNKQPAKALQDWQHQRQPPRQPRQQSKPESQRMQETTVQPQPTAPIEQPDQSQQRNDKRQQRQSSSISPPVKPDASLREGETTSFKQPSANQQQTQSQPPQQQQQRRGLTTVRTSTSSSTTQLTTNKQSTGRQAASNQKNGSFTRPHTLEGASRQKFQHESFPSGSRSCASTSSVSDAAFSEWCHKKAREQRERKEKQAHAEDQLKQQMLALREEKKARVAAKQPKKTNKQRREGLYHPKLDYVLAEIAFSPYRVRPGDPYRQTQVKFLQEVRRLHYSGDHANREPPAPKAVSPQMSVASTTMKHDDASMHIAGSTTINDKSQHRPPAKQLPKLLVKKCREDVNEVLHYRPNFDYRPAKDMSVPLHVQMQVPTARPKSSGLVSRVQVLDWEDDGDNPNQSDRFTAVDMHSTDQLPLVDVPAGPFFLDSQSDMHDKPSDDKSNDLVADAGHERPSAQEEDDYSQEQFD